MEQYGTHNELEEEGEGGAGTKNPPIFQYWEGKGGNGGEKRAVKLYSIHPLHYIDRYFRGKFGKSYI